MKHYYHLYSNGNDAKNFIITEGDFVAAFNRIGLCCCLSGVSILSFSIEDTHIHALLYGTSDECNHFKRLFEEKSLRSIVANVVPAMGFA